LTQTERMNAALEDLMAARPTCRNSPSKVK